MAKKPKDSRYDAVKHLIQTGNITSLKAAFKIIPITVVKTDAGIHYATLHRKIHEPGLLKLDEMIVLADLFGVTPQEFMGLALTDLGYEAPDKTKG